jgi:hypothetical protein
MRSMSKGDSEAEQRGLSEHPLLNAAAGPRSAQWALSPNSPSEPRNWRANAMVPGKEERSEKPLISAQMKVIGMRN